MNLRAAVLISIAVVVLVAVSRERPHVVQLPKGTMDVHREMLIEPDTEVRGDPSGTVLRMAADFTGRAAIVVKGNGVTLRDFAIQGNRDALEVRTGLPAYDVPFVRFTGANGILAEGVRDFTVGHVEMREIAGFAVLVSRGQNVEIDRVTVVDSGSRNAAGRNNSTGGILLEEGTAHFRVTGCELRNIRGNGVWTHSLYASPRNADGVIEWNRFRDIGRDAIQAGHAVRVRVEQNSGSRIGFPTEMVDIEGRAIPVAIDTAGNVEDTSYMRNRFEEINGKCMDLDGFHDGEIRANTCINSQGPQAYPLGNYGIVMNNSNPDMQSRNIRITENLIQGPLFGGIFVIGSGHWIAHNRLLNLNTAHCNEDAARFGCYYGAGEPDMLQSGIYLGRRAERPAPAQNNRIEGNEITGFKMQARCVVSAPGIEREWNTVKDNRCSDFSLR